MTVTTAYTGPFSEIALVQGETVALEGSTLADLIAALTAKHGVKFKETFLDLQSGSIRPGMLALVDGRRFDLGDKLEDGSEVAFVMAIAGGAM